MRFINKWFGVFALCGVVVTARTAGATLTHQYTFNNGTVDDSVGGVNGTAVNGADFVTIGNQAYGRFSTAGTNSSNTQRFEFSGPAINIPSYTSLTVETWFTLSAPAAPFTQLWNIGGTNDGSPTTPPEDNSGFGYGYLISNLNNNGGNNVRARLTYSPTPPGTAGFTAEEFVSTPFGTGSGGPADIIPPNVQHHLVATMAPSGVNNVLTLYIDGVLQQALTMSPAESLAALSSERLFLGGSLYNGDSGIAGLINEFDIYNNALTPAEVSAHFESGPIPVPEPATAVLGLIGLANLACAIRRRRPKAND